MVLILVSLFVTPLADIATARPNVRFRVKRTWHQLPLIPAQPSLAPTPINYPPAHARRAASIFEDPICQAIGH